MPFQLEAQIPASAQGFQINPFAVQAGVQQMQAQQEQAAALADQRRAVADQRRAQTEAAAREAREAQALQQIDYAADPRQVEQQVFTVVGPKRGFEIIKGLQALRTQEVKDYGELQKVVGQTLGGLQALPEALRPDTYKSIRGQFVQRGWLKADQIPEDYTPEFVTMAQQWSLTPKEQIEANAPKQHTVGGSLVETRPGQDGATLLFQAPEKGAAAGSFEAYADSVAQSLGLKSGRQLNPQQVLKAKSEYEAAGRAPKDPNSTPRLWVLRGGEHVRVTESEIQPGDKPASNRDVGRQVTSGDAGAIAEFNTALDDIGVLRQTLTSTKGATGTASAIAASIPNWASGLVGWKDAPAKTRQAAIDRVKQVIGKALEGGVLRKEDEVKYGKILPTISDSHEVALAKLDGLEAAIKQRQSRTIDALEQANYDVSRFRDAQGQGGAPVGGDDAAIKALRDAGKPVTPANIAFVKKQMGQP